MELSHDSSLLTTFITPFGRFCFKRLPFGITSTPSIFLSGVVCLMDNVLPLVPLLSNKPLDQLPIRVQRFHLRMMRFDYVITHVSGKRLQIVDALSRSPVSSATDADHQFQKDVSAYVDLLIQTLPTTDHQLHAGCPGSSR